MRKMSSVKFVCLSISLTTVLQPRATDFRQHMYIHNGHRELYYKSSCSFVLERVAYKSWGRVRKSCFPAQVPVIIKKDLCNDSLFVVHQCRIRKNKYI